MTSLNSRMQLALINRKKGRNLLEKGFTLVELMIVIAIVGVLSAVALPNFLSQTDKAKATEAKTVASAYLKQIYAAYQEGGSTAAGQPDGTGSIPCPENTKYFSYACDEDGSTNQIVATGLAASGNLNTKTITSSVNLTGTAAVTGGAAAIASGTITIGNPV
ncbi:type IV pilin protein [Synechococcus sp. Cu2B8-bc1011]|uniref:type IV pilin protein n=1 Tax=Synechococcus sp. Cu2B8-bc1011 TaxID=3093725 RepID=UPI0039AF6D61